MTCAQAAPIARAARRKSPFPNTWDAYNQKILTGNDKAILARLDNHWDIPKRKGGQNALPESAKDSAPSICLSSNG